MGVQGRTHWSWDSLPVSYEERKLSPVTTRECNRSLVLLGFCCFAFPAYRKLSKGKELLKEYDRSLHSPARYWPRIVVFFLIVWDNKAEISLCSGLECLQPLNVIVQQSVQRCLWEGGKEAIKIHFVRCLQRNTQAFSLPTSPSRRIQQPPISQGLHEQMSDNKCAVVSACCLSVIRSTCFLARTHCWGRDSAPYSEPQEKLGVHLARDLPWTKAVQTSKILQLEVTEK